MILDKKIAVVMPAYNAEFTLRRTYEEIPKEIVDDVILVDDASRDRTVEVARELGLHHVVHPKNRGYGGNQKTCYQEALARGADIVIMMHPDYQYTPKLIPAMAGMIAGGIYDVVLASRILGRGALKGGMPRYKYVFNRFLTATQNLLMRQKLSEYHTGYRAFSREVLLKLPLLANSDDFIFDNQMLAQAAYFDFRIGEISCPTHYSEDSSSINFRRSVVYGLGVLGVSVQYALNRWGALRSKIFHHRSANLNPSRSEALSPHDARLS
ncbi:glycosyltransferase family 2 protein [Deltaproteobacteria bacterium PRO3]|nr:glycosyltransferase family 2 protein [Deltaproteobacteria bacterium PRO3]